MINAKRIKKNKLVAVCIDHHSKTASLIRTAKRKAREMDVEWMAIYINSTKKLSARNKIKLINNFELVKNSGGQLIELEDSENSISKTISKFVRESFNTEKPIKHLIIGYKDNFLKKPLSEKVVKYLRGICEVQINPLQNFHEPVNILPKKITSEILYAVLAPVIFYILFLAAAKIFPNLFPQSFIENIFIFYLVIIIASALKLGTLNGLISAVISFIIVVFLHLTSPSNITIAVNLILFFGSSIMVSFINHSNNFHKTGNLTKDRALKVINKISQIKSATFNIDEMVNLIRKRLDEDLGGKFSIIFDEEKIYGAGLALSGQYSYSFRKYGAPDNF
jgi:K+-sensing histidine kinase KdpD